MVRDNHRDPEIQGRNHLEFCYFFISLTATRMGQTSFYFAPTPRTNNKRYPTGPSRSDHFTVNLF